MQTEIFIKGARENNLKNIDVTIPRDKLVVLTGLSGSGKSSLAFSCVSETAFMRFSWAPSALNSTSLIREDFPLPLTPVTQVNVPRGMDLSLIHI